MENINSIKYLSNDVVVTSEIFHSIERVRVYMLQHACARDKQCIRLSFPFYTHGDAIRAPNEKFNGRNFQDPSRAPITVHLCPVLIYANENAICIIRIQYHCAQVAYHKFHRILHRNLKHKCTHFAAFSSPLPYILYTRAHLARAIINTLNK